MEACIHRNVFFSSLKLNCVLGKLLNLVFKLNLETSIILGSNFLNTEAQKEMYKSTTKTFDICKERHISMVNIC